MTVSSLPSRHNTELKKLGTDSKDVVSCCYGGLGIVRRQPNLRDVNGRRIVGTLSFIFVIRLVHVVNYWHPAFNELTNIDRSGEEDRVKLLEVGSMQRLHLHATQEKSWLK